MEENGSSGLEKRTIITGLSKSGNNNNSHNNNVIDDNVIFVFYTLALRMTKQSVDGDSKLPLRVCVSVCV